VQGQKRIILGGTEYVCDLRQLLRATTTNNDNNESVKNQKWMRQASRQVPERDATKLHLTRSGCDKIPLGDKSKSSSRLVSMSLTQTSVILA
jgi:hypothetical protein